MGSDPIIDPTAHDLFDAGLWTIDDNLRIQVAKSDIDESILPGGSHFKLADLDGRPLSFAPQATLRPDPTHLAWHRRKCLAKTVHLLVRNDPLFMATFVELPCVHERVFFPDVSELDAITRFRKNIL